LKYGDSRSGAKRLAQEKLSVQADPLRLAIVDHLSCRPSTAGALARAIGEPSEKVRYRLRKMRKAGLVDVAGTARRSRVRETIYQVDPEMLLLSDSDLSELSPIRLEEAHVRVLRQLYQESIQAARAGIFSQRPEHRLVRLPITLDSQGWSEAVAVHNEVLSEALAIRRGVQQRLERDGRESIRSLVTILCFPRCEDAGGTSGSAPRRRSTAANDLGSSRLEQEALAATDPARMTIITCLTLTPASAAELADRLGMPLSRIRYEIGRLVDAGLVRVYAGRPRRGTVERVYFAESCRETYDHGGRTREELVARKRADVQVVNAVFREAVEATRAGHFEARTESLIARVPMTLDERGVTEIARVIGGALERLFALRAESQMRLEAGGTWAVQAAMCLMLFGVPA
jgi:DNA-binding transcriptional ArsR family regulator